MDNNARSTALVLTILLGIFLQVIFAFADSVQTPAKTAIKFSKTLFMLDESAADYLCSGIYGNEKQRIVEEYIYSKNIAAQNRGFNHNYTRSTIHNIKTDTNMIGKKEATVRIQAEKMKYHNPVFTFFAKIFGLGGKYPVDKTIRLIKENGDWKVCERDVLAKL